MLILMFSFLIKMVASQTNIELYIEAIDRQKVHKIKVYQIGRRLYSSKDSERMIEEIEEAYKKGNQN